MASVSVLVRLATLAGILVGSSGIALAQDTAAADKPVTPPDSYRVVMENDRVRMIEIHVKPHSKVNVDSPPGRDRFLYMLSDGALILAAPGKTPYEFALNAGETAVFPAISPTVENDTDSAVRALMVEIKEPMRSAAASKGKGRVGLKSKSRGTAAGKAKARPKQAAKSRKPKAAVKQSGAAPLNLRKAASRPARKVTGKGKPNSG